ncbi:MAG TPA: PLP-dependent aminotransferase family protein, partial [Abditibacteriaceae bacterium]
SPNFNNPLGSCMSDENKQRLVEILAERNVPLIEDDVYGDIYFAPERPKVAKAYDKSGSVLLCSSFSKTLAPGYRIGWVAAGRYRKEIEHLKMVNTLAGASLTSQAVAEFLAGGGYDHYLRRIRKTYAQQVNDTIEAVGRYFPDGTKVTRPAGGHVVWVEMPGVNALKMFQSALREGISIAPGPIFSAQNKYGNCIRLNCGVAWTDNVERALQRLGEIAKSPAQKA